MAMFASNLFLRKIISLNADLFYLVTVQGKFAGKTKTSNQEEGRRGEGRGGSQEAGRQ